jgi:hypothetical protein
MSACAGSVLPAASWAVYRAPPPARMTVEVSAVRMSSELAAIVDHVERAGDAR